MLKSLPHLVCLWAATIVFTTLAKAQVTNVSGACASGAQFTIFERSSDFQEAAEFCAAQGSTLARIGNANEHFRVVDLLVASNFSLDYWIGKTYTCHAHKYDET